jgi:SAM-dependent methyltransferase
MGTELRRMPQLRAAKDILRAVARLAFRGRRRQTSLEYWDVRARALGSHAVFNLEHPRRDDAAVTELQRAELYPRLRTQLRGDEEVLLDFGCGPGRFSGDLASLIDGRVIAVDPVQHFLDLAPSHPAVDYRRMPQAGIPLPDSSVDVLWICLVLGGITEEAVLAKTLGELERVLAPGGLVFLSENTSAKRSGPHWKFRSIHEYTSLLSFAKLAHLGDYYDLGERISILAGRKASVEVESVNASRYGDHAPTEPAPRR